MNPADLTGGTASAALPVSRAAPSAGGLAPRKSLKDPAMEKSERGKRWSGGEWRGRRRAQAQAAGNPPNLLPPPPPRLPDGGAPWRNRSGGRPSCGASPPEQPVASFSPALFLARALLSFAWAAKCDKLVLRQLCYQFYCFLLHSF